MGRNSGINSKTLVTNQFKGYRTDISRACYALCSCNTSSTTGGISFYDKFFQPVEADKTIYSSTAYGGGVNNLYASTGGDVLVYADLFSSVSPTQTVPGSNGTTNFINATSACGEFGNSMIDTFSNITAANATRNRQSTKGLLNKAYFNSDHSDRSTAYILYSGEIRALSRIMGNMAFNKGGTTNKTITGLNVNMVGSASYNGVRKELAILSYVSGSTFNVILYSNVDFDRYPSPNQALSAADVTVVTKSVAFPSFTASSESTFTPNVVLLDNGSLYVTLMIPSSKLSLYSLTRDANTNFSAVEVTSKPLTTSYGFESGQTYGQKQIQSRDGGAVLNYCCYYHYGAGIRSFIIDKRNSTYSSLTTFDLADTSNGCQPIPYGDDGFACYYAGNYYTGNPTGGYIMATVERRENNGLFMQTNGSIFLPYSVPPNTTNYPGFTQVVDYSILTNQPVH